MLVNMQCDIVSINCAVHDIYIFPLAVCKLKAFPNTYLWSFKIGMS
jgi:hypothetical protein